MLPKLRPLVLALAYLAAVALASCSPPDVMRGSSGAGGALVDGGHGSAGAGGADPDGGDG